MKYTNVRRFVNLGFFLGTDARSNEAGEINVDGKVCDSNCVSRKLESCIDHQVEIFIIQSPSLLARARNN